MFFTKTKSKLFIGSILILCIPLPCQAGLLVSLDGLTLDNNNQAHVRVLAEPDGSGTVPTIDNFSLRLRIDPISGIGGGMLGILNDGEPLNARNNDPEHLFAGKGNVLFSADIFNNGQELEVIDSVGLFDTSATLSSQRLLTAFNISEDPLNPLAPGESFRISFDEANSIFFDETFSPVPASQIEFRSGVVTTTAVPEPSSLVLSLFGLAGALARKRRRDNRSSGSSPVAILRAECSSTCIERGR